MALWLILAVMTAAALAVIVLPFMFGREVVQGGSEVAVYKDQLTEIDRDLEAEEMDRAPAPCELRRRLDDCGDGGVLLVIRDDTSIRPHDFAQRSERCRLRGEKAQHDHRDTEAGCDDARRRHARNKLSPVQSLQRADHTAGTLASFVGP